MTIPRGLSLRLTLPASTLPFRQVLVCRCVLDLMNRSAVHQCQFAAPFVHSASFLQLSAAPAPSPPLSQCPKVHRRRFPIFALFLRRSVCTPHLIQSQQPIHASSLLPT